MSYLPILILVLAVGAWVLWKQRSFASAEQVKAYVQHGAKVIDVRSPAEYASGHLAGAVNIPVGELRSQISRHAASKEEPLLLHCASGVRSGMGKRTLQQMGYTRVLNLGSYGRAERMITNYTRFSP